MADSEPWNDGFLAKKKVFQPALRTRRGLFSHEEAKLATNFRSRVRRASRGGARGCLFQG